MLQKIVPQSGGLWRFWNQ